MGVHRAFTFALPFVVGMLVSGCTGCTGCTGSDGEHLSFLDPQGPIAAAQRLHFFEVICLLLIVVVPVPWLAWRYRLGNPKSCHTLR